MMCIALRQHRSRDISGLCYWDDHGWSSQSSQGEKTPRAPGRFGHGAVVNQASPQGFIESHGAMFWDLFPAESVDTGDTGSFWPWSWLGFPQKSWSLEPTQWISICLNYYHASIVYCISMMTKSIYPVRAVWEISSKKNQRNWTVSMIASLKETLISFTLMEACSLGDSGHQLAEIQDTSIPFFLASDSLEKISEASGISMDISLSKSQP